MRSAETSPTKMENFSVPCWPGRQVPAPRAALKVAGSQPSQILMVSVSGASARARKSRDPESTSRQTATKTTWVRFISQPPLVGVWAYGETGGRYNFRRDTSTEGNASQPLLDAGLG